MDLAGYNDDEDWSTSSEYSTDEIDDDEIPIEFIRKKELVVNEIKRLPHFKSHCLRQKVHEEIKKFDRSSLKPSHRSHWAKWWKSLIGL